MDVILSHGLEGTPTGEKITRLAAVARACGHAPHIPDYRDIEPMGRLPVLKSAIDALEGPFVLAGSSLGALISVMVHAQCGDRCRGMFLLAPAVGLEFENAPLPEVAAPTVIVHGWRDELVPFDDVLYFARDNKLDLMLVDSDHRLNDVIPFLEKQFELFLQRLV